MTSERSKIFVEEKIEDVELGKIIGNVPNIISFLKSLVEKHGENISIVEEDYDGYFYVQKKRLETNEEHHSRITELERVQLENDKAEALLIVQKKIDGGKITRKENAILNKFGLNKM